MGGAVFALVEAVVEHSVASAAWTWHELER